LPPCTLSCHCIARPVRGSTAMIDDSASGNARVDNHVAVVADGLEDVFQPLFIDVAS
jgi:hypothetical protein